MENKDYDMEVIDFQDELTEPPEIEDMVEMELEDEPDMEYEE